MASIRYVGLREGVGASPSDPRTQGSALVGTAPEGGRCIGGSSLDAWGGGVRAGLAGTCKVRTRTSSPSGRYEDSGKYVCKDCSLS